MPIYYSRKECNQKGREIENNIKRRFGWIVKITVSQNGRFSWRKVKGRDRYDLYPGMSKDQADKAIVKDILAVIRQSLPGARLTDYYQSGKMHYPTQ